MLSHPNGSLILMIFLTVGYQVPFMKYKVGLKTQLFHFPTILLVSVSENSRMPYPKIMAGMATH